jgi:hypothetical protein
MAVNHGARLMFTHVATAGDSIVGRGRSLKGKRPELQMPDE